MKVNDLPVTAKELDSFYGVDADRYQVYQAVKRYKDSFDVNDLYDCLAEQIEGITANVWAGDECEVGRIVTQAIKQYVAQLASSDCECTVTVEDV